MKRFSLILMLALTLCACANEDDYNLPNDSEAVESFSITPDEAAGIALDFATAMREGEQTRTGANEVLSVHNVQPLRNGNITTRSEISGTEISIDTLLYVVNFSDEQGFALVAADKRTTPIYAIADSGSLDFDNLGSEENIGFLLFLEGAVGKIVQDVNTNDAIETRATTNGWTIIEKYPAMLKTKWNQTAPYNMYCPNNRYTGCTVTATAQILSYYQTIGSVSWSDNGSSGSATLNWSRIISDCEKNAGKLNTTSYYASSSEVAHLMRYLGVAMDADYDADGTGVNKKKPINWMNDWGGLNATKLADYSASPVINAIKNNKLVYARGNSGRKKFLGITVSYTGGHAWVYDGYVSASSGGTTSNLLHCNWGWGGYQDGYYISGAFNSDAGAEIYDWEVTRSNEDATDEGSDGNFQYNLEYSIVSR